MPLDLGGTLADVKIDDPTARDASGHLHAGVLGARLSTQKRAATIRLVRVN